MAFSPGQSGNITGRKPDSPEMKRARELFRSYTEEAAKFLGVLVRDVREDVKHRLQAANIILDRAFGKPAIDMGNDAGQHQTQFDPNHLMQLLADLHKQKAEMEAMEAELKSLKASKKDDS